MDSGASGTFISDSFCKRHKIRTHKLSKPFPVITADGLDAAGGLISHYCVLTVKTDERTMIGKFNVARLAKQDKILLGFPWLKALNPDINWVEGTLSLPATECSLNIERSINLTRKHNELPPLFLSKMPAPIERPPMWKNSKLKKATQMTAVNDLLPSKTASVEEVPDEDDVPSLMPDQDEDQPDYNTKEDVWSDNFAPAVNNVSTYKLDDDEVLIEYAPDGLQVRVIEEI